MMYFFIMLSCFLVLALSTQIITWDALENRTPDDICKLYEDNYVFQKTGNCYTEGEGCQYGTQSAEDIDHTTRRINFYRVITGLLPTTTGTEEVYRDNVNQACIIMQKNKIFSHSLTNTSLECWSQSGQTGAASSNIYYASVNTCSTSSISAYMGSLGHRRWVLHPPLISAYASVVGGYSALKVFGMPNNGSAEAFFIAYPPPGPVPYNVI
ncbi:hypothetical protein TRFO_05715 [Tritrichomonas foetus]|uniref:SCP domain-containing protein n=1 Tax=Tritrichomonas foetus TaxID=1144522 RepID=A0A1J4K8M3_9EUKA|nr:hypothetical protein TRFO_05715 [Tritrichomonas foetus]|eukprot:OHT06060.1 hypothetical protein TRFO_05715 [Tritrichomonas foetus]